MRLWHYKLLPVLPDKFIVAEWRELIAIKRQWEKGTLKHRLVSYVMDYDKNYFVAYVLQVIAELENRKIKYDKNLWEEILKMTDGNFSGNDYPEHNDRYLVQCLYNLQEKADRGIISQEEWKYIEDNIKIDNWTVGLMEKVVSTNKHGDFTFKLPAIQKI